MAFVLWFSLNHTPIKYKGPIKKSNQITPWALNTILYSYIIIIEGKVKSLKFEHEVN